MLEPSSVLETGKTLREISAFPQLLGFLSSEHSRAGGATWQFAVASSRRLARSEDSFAPDAAPAVKDPRAPRTFQSASRFQRFIAHTFN
jgi:hypothetical protein